MALEFEGTVLAGTDLTPTEGRVVVDEATGRIDAVESTATDSTDLICPAFVNAHTHLGDSIAKEAGAGLSLDELVAPPDGLKHRLLRAADPGEVAAAMARSLRYMRATGTGGVVEFREGGVAGVETMRDALALAFDEGGGDPLGGRDGTGVDPEADPGAGAGDDDAPAAHEPAVRGRLASVILGRETADAMRAADGFGASGARDGDFATVREATREAGKPFGIHAGERDPDDVAAALDLDPDHLVHMTNATDDQLDRVGAAGIPVVCCPRSNLVTDVGVPPLAALAERTTVALGTDNAMLNAPSMFRELEFAAKLSGLPADRVLRMATVDAAAVAGLDCGAIEPGREARLLVLDGDSDNLAGARDPVRAVVRRAGASDVRRVLLPDAGTEA